MARFGVDDGAPIGGPTEVHATAHGTMRRNLAAYNAAAQDAAARFALPTEAAFTDPLQSTPWFVVIDDDDTRERLRCILSDLLALAIPYAESDSTEPPMPRGWAVERVLDALRGETRPGTQRSGACTSWVTTIWTGKTATCVRGADHYGAHRSGDGTQWTDC